MGKIQNRFREHVIPSWSALLNLFYVFAKTLCFSVSFYLYNVLLSQVFLERFKNTQTTDGSMALTSAAIGTILFYRLRLPGNWGGITCCAW